MPRSSLFLPVIFALGVALGVALAAAPAAGRPPLLLADSGHTLLWDGVPVHATSHRISEARAIPLPGADGVAVVWREAAADGRSTNAYAVSLDGRRFARVREASYVLRLRFAEFDPLARRPEIAPALAADPAGELAIVQFLTRPLAEYANAIRAAGGEVHMLLADQALIARLPPASRAAVARMAVVRWVGPVHPAYKLEEEILAALAAPGVLATPSMLVPRRYSIMCYERGPAAQERVAAVIRAAGGIVHGSTPAGFRLEATLDGEQVLAAAGHDDVMFIDRKGEQEADMDVVRALGGGDYVHTTLGFHGTGVTGEVMDTELELTHPEWAHPPLVHLPGGDIAHGTRVYGIVFAQGLNPRARGLLPDGQGIYAYRTPLLGGGPTRYEHTAELVDPTGPYRAVFQTVSTGDALTTAYTTISAEMDDILFLYDILITQSQSNNGDQMSRPQAWAKNIVACGGIKHLDTLDRSDDGWRNYASIGPAADGRVKPDLAHFCDYIYTATVGGGYTTSGSGTSVATPITAGHFGLLFQMWHEGVFPGFGGGASVFDDRPHMTTARALMINTAYRYDWHVAGPNSDLDRFKQGWGTADLRKLHDDRERLLIIDESDLLAPFDVREYTVDVGTDDTELRATLVYADPRGNVGSTRHRINDLSLRATSPGGTIYWGNQGLAADNWSVAGGVSNTIDTVENVLVADPEPGAWTLEVIADEVIADSHPETPALDADFALVAAAHGPPPPPPPPPPILWDNGPLVTHPGQGAGGADASARQSVTLGESVMGYSHQVASGARVADDFTADDEWTVEQVELFAYQTGAGPANPTITRANIRIWDGSPLVPGSRVLHGDSLTDLLVAAVWDTLYRTDETNIATATDRAVYRLTCTIPGWTLAPGTYWIDWQVDGTLTSGPFVPPISIPGATHPPGANAVQFTSGSWHPVVDAGNQTPDDFKFVLRGETGTPAGISAGASAPARTAVMFRPNPFRAGVAIELALARPGETSLRLYDIAGRLARELVAGRLPEGSHAVRWDGRDGDGTPLPAGVYLYELRVDGQVRDRGKAMLLR